MAHENEFPGTILIIDDHSGNSELCQVYLEIEGFLVHVAANGKEGLERTRQICPDIVLLDVMMPVMDGFQMLKALKSDPATSNIPVLVHSADNESATAVKALQMGASDFLKKPFHVDEMVVRVKKLMEEKKARDAIINASVELVQHQYAIDVALDKWRRDAEAFRKKCETSIVNILAESNAAFQLEKAISSSEAVRQLINRITNLSRQRLPEYDRLN